MNNFDFWLFQVCHFNKLLHIAITTANWSRLYKLLNVLLDASILFPGDDITVKSRRHVCVCMSFCNSAEDLCNHCKVNSKI